MFSKQNELADLYEGISGNTGAGFIKDSLCDPAVYGVLKQIWSPSGHYENFNFFSTPAQFQVFIDAAYYCKQRNTEGIDRFQPFESLFVPFFPLIDLVCSMYDISLIPPSRRPPNILRQVFDIFNVWSNRVKSSPPIPLEYPAQDYIAIRLLDKYITKVKSTAIGLARIENLDQNLSFFGSIAALLKFREKFQLLKLPSNLVAKYNTVGDLLLNFLDLTSNPNKTIDTEKLDELYGKDVVMSLTEISSVLYELYKQQLEHFVPDSTKVASLLKNKEIFSKFIGYPNSQPINWSLL